MEKSIAVFGGSFNPVANSHIFLANQILDKFKCIEKIVFIPVKNTYNKEGLIDDLHRYKLLEQVCNHYERFELSDIEMKSKVQPYTLETLLKLKQIYKENIYFVIGTDNLKEFETWYKPEEILNNFKILVLERNDDIMEEIIEKSSFLRENKSSFIKLDGIKRIDLSSTIIRNKIKNGEDISNLVPEYVKEYIEKEKLYA